MNEAVYLNALIEYAGEGHLSQEGLLDTVLPKGLIDTLYKFIQRLKLNLRNFGTGLSISELESFLIDNRKEVDRFLHDPIHPIPNILLPIPAGMMGTYHTTSVELNRALALTPDTLVYNSLLGLNQSARTLLRQDSIEAHRSLEKFYVTFRKRAGVDLDTGDVIIRTNFDTKHPFTTKPARDLYKNKAELKTTIDVINASSRWLRALGRISKTLDRQLELSDQIVSDMIDHPEHLTRDDILYIAGGLVAVAKLLEFKGICLNLLQQVEHQFVAGLKLLIAPQT